MAGNDAKELRCPIAVGGSLTHYNCVRESCAWWVPGEDDCAMTVTALCLSKMLERLEAQGKRRGYI